MKQESPTIYGIYACIVSLHGKNDQPKLLAKELFQKLQQKRVHCFDKNTSNHMKDIDHETYIKMIMDGVSMEHSVEVAEVLKTGCFFPNNPIIRTIADIRITHEKFDCTKIYKKCSGLGAGVLLFFCVQHSRCIGFIVLSSAESPKIISETLLTRFKIMPRIVLYDNSCNLQEFILNRNPLPFDDTQFLIDGFHYISHSNCANSYNSSDYPVICGTLNTSLVEQKNAQLRFMKRTSPYLKYNTFVMKLIYAAMNINNQASK